MPHTELTPQAQARTPSAGLVPRVTRSRVHHEPRAIPAAKCVCFSPQDPAERERERESTRASEAALYKPDGRQSGVFPVWGPKAVCNLVRGGQRSEHLPWGVTLTPLPQEPHRCSPLWEGQSRFQPAPPKWLLPLARWQGLCQRQKAPWDTVRVCRSDSLTRVSGSVGVFPRLPPSPKRCAVACAPGPALRFWLGLCNVRLH